MTSPTQPQLEPPPTDTSWIEMENARTKTWPPTRNDRRKAGPLVTTATVLAMIRDVLLIVVLGTLIYFGAAVLNALNDIGDTPAVEQQWTPPTQGWNVNDCQMGALEGEQTPPECDQYFGG